MLIRFQVKNLYSFKEETEFNLVPGSIKRLEHHKYQRGGLEFLKLSAIYGANGSGKSNLIRSISSLQSVVLVGAIQQQFITQRFRLSDVTRKEPVELAIEFFANNAIYYYSISTNDGIIANEYFSSNNANQEDQVIFERKQINHKSVISFPNGFEEMPENKILKRVIETNLLKPTQPLLSLLNAISHDAFIDVKAAFNWFKNDLTVIEKSRNFEFVYDKESEGTRRVLEYFPAFNSKSSTYVIDEISRSIHPLVVKEIIDKFSRDQTTKSQLIFTTHESNLLDQDILRTDEIWFTEKDIFGSTKIYPLSDFKESDTIDIREGYLNGRYGAIPFLGGLKDLNWHNFSGSMCD